MLLHILPNSYRNKFLSSIFNEKGNLQFRLEQNLKKFKLLDLNTCQFLFRIFVEKEENCIRLVNLFSMKIS